MTAQKETETTQETSRTGHKAGAAASLRRSPPLPGRRTAACMVLGAAAAAVLAAALVAAAAIPGHAEAPETGAGGMDPLAAAATASNGDAAASSGGAAQPADAASLYAAACGPLYGGHSELPADEPGAEWAANMTARMDELYAEHDAILAEYGFAYEEPPSLTGEQAERIDAEMNAVMARYDAMLDEAGALNDRPAGALLGHEFAVFGPQSAMAAVYQLMADEHDDILRRHGFVISTPQLSDADERRLSERLDAVMDRMDQVYEEYCTAEPPAPPGTGGAGSGADGHLAGHGHGAYGAAPHGGVAAPAAALYAEHDAILAEYGFVYKEPSVLTDAQLEQLDAKMSRLFERHADAAEALAARLAPMLANGSIAMPDAFAEDMRLADRANAEHRAILAEFGYVIVIPELSAADRDAMDERLDDIYAKIDAALEAAYLAHGESGASYAAASGPPGPAAPPPDGGGDVAYDVFDGDGQRGALPGAENSAPTAVHGYLTATPEPSAADGVVVGEQLAGIYAGIDAALGDGHSETRGSATGGDGDGGGG